MQIDLRPQARRELLAAQDWYERRAEGLGREFAHAVDAAVTLAARHPLAHPRVDARARRVLVRRFPYSVIYDVADDRLTVLAVFHHRRLPWPGPTGTTP
jgi:toxin ParE1/3/4